MAIMSKLLKNKTKATAPIKDKDYFGSVKQRDAFRARFTNELNRMQAMNSDLFKGRSWMTNVTVDPMSHMATARVVLTAPGKKPIQYQQQMSEELLAEEGAIDYAATKMRTEILEYLRKESGSSRRFDTEHLNKMKELMDAQHLSAPWRPSTATEKKMLDVAVPKPKPKKICPLCGETDSKYPEWTGECDHENSSAA